MAPSNSSAGNPVCSSASIAGCPLPDHGNELPTHLPTKRRLNTEEGARETPPKLRKRASSQANSKLPNEVSASIGEGKAPSKQGSDNQHMAKKKKPGLKKAEPPLQLHDQTAGKETDLPTASGAKKSSSTPVQIVEALPAFQPPPASRTVTRSASANLPPPVSQPVTKSTTHGAAATTKRPPTNGPITVSASGNVPPMLPPSPTEEIRGEDRAEDQKQVMNKWPLILDELIELGKECEHVGEAILREGLSNVRGAAAMDALVQQWKELKLAESATLLKRAELSTSVVKVALDAFRATS